AHEERERGVEREASGRDRDVQGGERGHRGALLVRDALRRGEGLEPRGAARRRGGGVLQHGAERWARAGGHAAHARGDPGRLHGEPGARRVQDHDDAPRRARAGARHRRGRVRQGGRGDEEGVPRVEGARGERRDHARREAAV
ncbi:MAG: Peroxiredoxin OsmC, partial [uncultured Gemmatimonadaceae bacterium]